MRRRRPQLQVTLFPFLSVLLCMLGALILLLLVLDQRARHVRSQESQARWREAEETALAVQARLESELQNRLQALRARRDALRAQIDSKAAEENRARHDSTLQETSLGALQRLLDAELARTEELNAGLRRKAEQAQNLRQQRSAKESEFARFLEQLKNLEQIVQRLQEAVRRRGPVYSLVPYRGKQGTRRQPLYVECVADQVVFRPDGERLSLLHAQLPGRVLDAIEQRFKRLPKSSDQEKPYVLLLVRPSGISLYYVIVRALQKANVDIGYEFLDEDWVLDFSPASDEALAASEQSSGETGIANQGSGGGNQLAETGTGNQNLSGPASVSQGGPGAASAGAVLSGPAVGSGVGGGKPGGAAGVSVVQAPSRAASEKVEQGAAATRPPAGNVGSKTAAGPVTLLPPTPTRPPGPQGQPSGGQRDGRPGGEKGSAGPRPETNSSANKQPEGTGGNEEGKGRLPRTETRTVDGPLMREWQIILECRADSVVLERTNQRFELAKLSGHGNPLAAAVADLIIKKRERLPDVRPELKFHIRPEGLRAYYAAAAALEPLALPAKWEVVRE